MKTMIGAVATLIAAGAFAVAENPLDYSAFHIGETPCGVVVSVFDGMDSRGISWQVTNGVESTEVQLLKGVHGAGDAALFESEGVKRTGVTRTSYVVNLGMDKYAAGYCAAYTGLDADSVYSYRIVARYEGGSRTACAYGTFAVREAARETVTIVNLNDAQTKDAAKYYQFANTCAAAATTAGGADAIDFVLSGGDFFHTKGEKMTNCGPNTNALNSTRWAMAAETATPYFPRVPWVHVGGNHDDSAYALTVAEAFALTNSPHAQGVTYVGGHSLTCGNVHVTTLPFNLMFDGKNYSADGMYAWLENDLRASLADANVKWRVVALHFGPYTTGDHALDSGNGYAETEAASNLVMRLAPMFASNRVDLVLQAHDHTYSKTVPYLWSGKGYATSEADATALNLNPTTETVGGVSYDVDPLGTYYLSAGCAGHRVGENYNYANTGTSKSYTHRNLKVATGRINVTSSVSTAGDNASKDTGKQMFGVLKATGDRLLYSFYVVPTAGNESVELYDTLAIRKTAASDAPLTPAADPDPQQDPDPVQDPEPEKPSGPTEEEERAAEIPTDYPPGVSTVQAIIDAYNAAKAGDVIYIEPGTYDLTGVQMATSGTSAQKSHFSFTKSITLVGTTNDASQVVLQGDGTSHRIIMFNKSGGTLTISNLTFTCGKPGEIGGGIYAYDGKVNCVNCRFVNNRATYGGGLGVRDSTAPACHLRFCAFIGNHAGEGGGLRLVNTNKGSAYRCTFEGNVATSKGGGASYGHYTNCTFRCNVCEPTTSVASCGGGALAYGDAFGCTVECNTNAVKNSHGGATYHTSPLVKCVFRGNYVYNNGVVAAPNTVDGCVFEGNYSSESIVRRAVTGGGTVRNSVFRWNRGVSIAAEDDSKRRTVYNCHFEFNTNSSVAIYCDFGNCTFVGNKNTNAPLVGSDKAVNCVFSGNLPRDVYASGYPDMTNCVFVTRNGTGALTGAVDCRQVADVKFADAARGDYHPKGARSPLYNAGFADAAYLEAVGATDLGGGRRVTFGRIDIGAYEAQKLPGFRVLIR